MSLYILYRKGFSSERIISGSHPEMHQGFIYFTGRLIPCNSTKVGQRDVLYILHIKYTSVYIYIHIYNFLLWVFVFLK